MGGMFRFKSTVAEMKGIEGQWEVSGVRPWKAIIHWQWGVVEGI